MGLRSIALVFPSPVFLLDRRVLACFLKILFQSYISDFYANCKEIISMRKLTFKCTILPLKKKNIIIDAVILKQTSPVFQSIAFLSLGGEICIHTNSYKIHLFKKNNKRSIWTCVKNEPEPINCVVHGRIELDGKENFLSNNWFFPPWMS